MTPDWRTVGQHRHVVLEHRRDDEGEVFVRTACNLLIWPSLVDLRMPDPPECAVCRMLYPARPAPG
jgi:hypothetical protein